MRQIQANQGRPEYATAFRSIRSAKNLAAFLLILALLLQIGGTVVLHFTDLLDEAVAAAPAAKTGAEPATAPKPAPETKPAPDTKPAAKADAATEPSGFKFDDPIAIAKVAMQYGMPASRFGALVLGLLLVLMVMFAVKLALIERIGGVAGFISAFNWSLILLMMLVPWRPILGSSLSCGALFTYSELVNANAALGQTPEMVDQVFFYGRFLAYPSLALLICMIIQSKFAKGFAAVKFRGQESEAMSARVNPQVYPPQK